MKRALLPVICLFLTALLSCREPQIDPALRVRPVGMSVKVVDSQYIVSWSGQYIVCAFGPCPDIADVEAELYEIQIAKSELEPFSTYAQVGPNTSSITIPDSKIGKQLIVRVVAINSKAPSKESNTVMASTEPIVRSEQFNGYGDGDEIWGGDLTLTGDRGIFIGFEQKSDTSYWFPLYVGNIVNGILTSPQRLMQSVRGAALSPDGKQIAYGARDQNAFTVLNLETGASRLLPVTDLTWLTSVDWSPDGKTLAYLVASNDDSQLWKVNVEGGQPQPLTPVLYYKNSNSLWKSSIAWTPDGRAVAASRSQMENVSRNTKYAITLFSAEGTGETGRFDTRFGWLDFNPSYSPDGKQLAFFSSRTGDLYGNSLWVRNLTTNQLKQIRVPTDQQLSSDFQPRWIGANRLVYMAYISGGSTNRPLRRYFTVSL